MMHPGPRNLITDVDGILVGNAEDNRIRTGTTVVTSDRQFTAAVQVLGGAPGTRETDLLSPENLVQQADALVLSGGSALGLAAAGGVADALRAMGRGFPVREQFVPIVPAAILMDLLNGGDKDWSENPYPELGKAALAATGSGFDLGSHGAGAGATMADFLGGLGSSSLVLDSGHTVGALIASNPEGSAVVGGGPHFWAAPWEFGDEFGGLGPAPAFHPGTFPATKFAHRRQATAIGVVATDASLSQAEAKRVAIAAHDGLARSLSPAHTLLDGDLIFVAATGKRELTDPVMDLMEIGHAAAICVARAVARGVYHAGSVSTDLLPSWQDRFGD